ncbi:DHA2 family efflux MFS transporter permease subunit [Curtobacterium aurantiacum]|uniref:DHA2 family efflux MFS transporter permease subunit n=1 Tax=Curtobacterium aurantiacum TaxID=3236919 RepID=A0ABS5VCM7_9MICO|nr:DHA2 family efflux MFS transporter permease subunit [Curtobacterium flaccumfaciens]MBT1544423.1 DHA2 family efflux MFS transporter permease subunit [Curtobacterium flaccumfaciens pv. flaccumfaciens]MBT1587251.1 DHA2 family efflux MFS transporter permease subunit [Curtobacterium flaccumfaciens pv. flaccumfaciens]
MTTSARTHSKPPSTDRLKPGDGLVLGLLMASTFLVLLNEMLLGVAIPTLIRDLGVTPSAGQWLTTGYLLTLAVLIPATGFIMRRFHLRTIFLTALSTFIVGTAISAVAPGFAVLLVGRVVQAVGTAVFVPLLMTTAIRLVPESRRGRIMALVTAVPAIAPAVGPAISGLVLTFLPWRWLFILVLPLAMIALVAGAMKLKNITAPERATLDLFSVALSAVGFGALVFGLSLIGESAEGHAPVPPVIPIIVGVLGVAGFVFRQLALRRHGDAFLDMRIFRSKAFVVPILVMLFVALNGFGILLVLPLVLTGSLGLSTLSIGLFLVPGGIVISVVSALGGRVYDRYGPLPLAIPGAIIWAASIWFLSALDNRSSVWVYLAGYLVMTAAQAMMWAPMTTLALSSLRAELYPHGSAAFSAVQQLAGAAGGAVLVSAYTIGSNAVNAGELSVVQTVAAGQTAFMTAGIIAVAAVIGTLAIGRRRAAPPAAVDVA